jgi:hypothetical protein
MNVWILQIVRPVPRFRFGARRIRRQYGSNKNLIQPASVLVFLNKSTFLPGQKFQFHNSIPLPIESQVPSDTCPGESMSNPVRGPAKTGLVQKVRQYPDRIIGHLGHDIRLMMPLVFERISKKIPTSRARVILNDSGYKEPFEGLARGGNKLGRP